MHTPSHRNTSSVGGISALVYKVSLSSNEVSIGSPPSLLSFRNCTVSRVFSMSGNFPLRPATRRCRLSSMNWYFLHHHKLFSFNVTSQENGKSAGTNPRYHLLEPHQRRLDLGPARHVILHIVHKWRLWDSSWVRWRCRIVAESKCQLPNCCSSTSSTV